MRNPVTGAPAHRVKKVFVEIDSDDDDDVMEFVDNKQPELQDMFRQLERKLQLRHKGIQAAGSLETGISKDPAFFMAKLRERAVSALGGGGGAGDTSDKDTRRVKFETRAVSGTDPGVSVRGRCKSVHVVRGRLSSAHGASTAANTSAMSFSEPRAVSESGQSIVAATPLNRPGRAPSKARAGAAP